jgi:hypothetical protein
MGICSSDTSKHKHFANHNGGAPYSGGQPNPNMQNHNNNNNFKSLGSTQQEEAYYQEIGLSNDLGGDFGPKEKIQLNAGIRNGRMNSPYYLQISIASDANGSNKVLVGQTKEEILMSPDGSLNFSISFLMDYFFERQQHLFINIRGGVSVQSEIKTTLGRVMGSRGQTLTLPTSDNSQEQLVLSANTVKNNNIVVNLAFSVSQMNKSSNMFYLIKKLKSISQINQNNQMNQNNGVNNNNTVAYNPNDFWKIQKSELKQVGTYAVNFNPIKIPAMFLCNGDYDHPIAIEFHSPQERVVLAVHITTVNKLLSERNFTVGGLNVTCTSELIKEHTFIDYLRGGTQLSLTLGIDFTGSNGNPRDRDSLHRINEDGKPNQYQLAIRSCGDILAYYDYDQTFPVYGYGAILPNTSWADHCFPLNLQQDPNIKTIDGVLNTYCQVMPTLSFSGPTNFAPLLTQTINNIKSFNNPNVYNILLILTDGMINDMDQTIDALVEASFMPLSVIIVGIGTGDFGNMDLLDADGKGLSDSRGRRAGRDLVQFVPFYKFAGNGQKLAEQVLAEVPRQLCDYYKMIKKPPGDPIVNI